MDHVLTSEFEVPVGLEQAFAFFAHAGNLERITPPDLRFRILTPEPIAMQVGTRIQYRLQLLGVPFGWTTLISVWDPPHAFRDEQIRGPYALWEHTHAFTATEAGTRIRDVVRYRLPLWPLGEVAYPIVRAQLGRIFAFRQAAVGEALVDAGAGSD